VVLALCCGALLLSFAQDAKASHPQRLPPHPPAGRPPRRRAAEVVCFESRKGGATDVTQRELKPGCPT
jgi:hypothetical protein